MPFYQRDGNENECEDEDVPAGSVFFDAVDGHTQHARKLDGDNVGAYASQRAPHVSPAVAAHVAQEWAEIAEHGLIVAGELGIGTTASAGLASVNPQ